jgi:hypothetical protein
MPIELILYSTSACHLCEQALALMQPLLGEAVQVREVDISHSEELFQRYGTTIPVLRAPSAGRELNWPFTAAEVVQFLEGERS